MLSGLLQASYEELNLIIHKHKACNTNKQDFKAQQLTVFCGCTLEWNLDVWNGEESLKTKSSPSSKSFTHVIIENSLKRSKRFCFFAGDTTFFFCLV